MKNFLVLNLFIFHALFSMEQDNLKDYSHFMNLPEDIWVVITGFLIEDKIVIDEDSPKKIFINLDIFKISSKRLKSFVDKFVKNCANKKFENIKDQVEKLKFIANYKYLNYKQDFMISIWDEKIKESDVNFEKQIERAEKLKAYLWSKREAKINQEYKNNLHTHLYDKFIKFSLERGGYPCMPWEKFLKLGLDVNSEFGKKHDRLLSALIVFSNILSINLPEVSLLLKFGADPNFIISIDKSNQVTLLKIVADRKDLELGKLLLMNYPLKADPNLVFLVNGKKRTVLTNLLLSSDFGLSEKNIDVLKLLLKYGADPRFEFEYDNDNFKGNTLSYIQQYRLANFKIIALLKDAIEKLNKKDMVNSIENNKNN